MMVQGSIHRIGVLTSGGDAPGMNACLRAIVRCAASRGLEVVGIRRGYAGIFARDFLPLGTRQVSNILQRGGTFLESSRCREMMTVVGRERVIQILREEAIDSLVTIGGEGTFRGAQALAQEGGLKVVGVPATIDNDVYGTDYTIGFDTAVNTALEAIDKIRDTVESLERLFFVEVMGRTRGFIALDVGVAGGAEEILVPEIETDIDKLCQVLEQSFARGKRSSIVVVAEGDTPGGAVAIGREVGASLGLDYRVCVLGHVQRGGSPTARDRLLASELGAAAINALMEGRHGCMVGEVRGEIAYTPLEQTWQRSKELPRYLLQLLRVLST